MKQVRNGTLKVQSIKNNKTGATSWIVVRFDGCLELFPGVNSDVWATIKTGFTSKADAAKWVKDQNKKVETR